MNYPLWVVPILGGPWIIGIVAIIHIFISHFAVGGGAFLAVVEGLAYRRKDERIYDYLKQHSFFFVIITTVSGALTGVGIWFCISLVKSGRYACAHSEFHSSVGGRISFLRR